MTSTYIKQINKNVILPEGKTTTDFMNDYNMWNGCESGLKDEGYHFPDSEKTKNKIIQKQEEHNKLQKKRKNNKKAKKEKYNTGKYDRKSHPFYGKPLDERKRLQKEYGKYLQDEKQTKENRMKEMMEHLSTMSEEEQKEYMAKLMSDMGTTPEELTSKVSSMSNSVVDEEKVDEVITNKPVKEAIVEEITE